MIEVVAGSDYDLETFYRAQGYHVIATHRRGPIRWPLMLTNCVSMTKAVLGINAFWVRTPRQLYQYLR